MILDIQPIAHKIIPAGFPHSVLIKESEGLANTASEAGEGFYPAEFYVGDMSATYTYELVDCRIYQGNSWATYQHKRLEILL